MSAILWCDINGHAFSANDPNRATYLGTKIIDNEREVIDVCGPCKREGFTKAMPLPVAVASVQAPTSAPTPPTVVDATEGA